MTLEEWQRTLQQQLQDADAERARLHALLEAVQTLAHLVGPASVVTIRPAPARTHPHVTLTERAVQVLEQAGTALRIEPLAELVSQRHAQAVTPEALENALNRHIRRYGARSPFLRPEARTYRLRVWQEEGR
jgi:hypothetical protein